MVDAVVREWLRQTLGDDAAKDGVAHMAAKFIALFYVDDAFIASRDHVFLQNSLDTLISVFERVGLYTNVQKTKSMTFLPGKIRPRFSNELYERRFGSGEQEEVQDQVQCDICKKMLKPASLRKHLERQHNVYTNFFEEYKDLMEEREPMHYTCQLFQEGICCPVEGCGYGGGGVTPHSMRRHFSTRHECDFVHIPSEGPKPYPRCEKCNMQVNCFTQARWESHWKTAACRQGNEKRLQREAWKKAARAMDVKFYAYGQELERVELFKYLGKLTSNDDKDIQAIRNNLKKARRTWARMSNVCRSENVPPKTAAIFYQAVIQSVLLFGSETWCLTETTLKELRGFHITAAYRMAKVHRPRKDEEGVWTYSSSKDVLEEVGLLTIDEYIERRRNKVAEYASNRPVLELCLNERRRRGTTRREKFWWEQLPQAFESVE